MTQVLAGVLGLKDHVVLKVGNRADVNVFDVSKLEGRMPEIGYDFFLVRCASFNEPLAIRTISATVLLSCRTMS